jgi:hypothetical protein
MYDYILPVGKYSTKGQHTTLLLTVSPLKYILKPKLFISFSYTELFFSFNYLLSPKSRTYIFIGRRDTE